MFIQSKITLCESNLYPRFHPFQHVLITFKLLIAWTSLNLKIFNSFNKIIPIWKLPQNTKSTKLNIEARTIQIKIHKNPISSDINKQWMLQFYGIILKNDSTYLPISDIFTTAISMRKAWINLPDCEHSRIF